MSWSAAEGNPLSHVLPHPIREIEADLGLLTPEGKITLLSDQVVMMILAGLLLILFLPRLLRRRRGADETARLVPSGFANFVELICEYFRKEVAEPQLGKYTDRFIKYIWSVFFFVLTVNLLGLLPLGILSPLVFGGHHWIGGTATANIWITATLAILTLILMVWNGLRIGGKAYLAHFSPGPLWMAPLMVVIEIMGLFAKIFALAVRLFANMIAGHILLVVLLGLIFTAAAGLGAAGGLGVALFIVPGSVAISLLEIFVAFLQAFIFTYLTTLFIAMSINVHHEEHPHDVAVSH